MGKVFRINRFRGSSDFSKWPPAVRLHDVGFQRFLPILIDGVVGNANQKVAFVGGDVVSVGGDEIDIPLSDFFTDVRDDAGFFEEFAPRRVPVALAMLVGAARRRLKRLPSQCAFIEHEPKQQDAVLRI